MDVWENSLIIILWVKSIKESTQRGGGGQTLENTYNKLTIKWNFSVLYVMGVLEDFQKLKISKNIFEKVNFQSFFTSSRSILKVNDYDLHCFETKNL